MKKAEIRTGLLYILYVHILFSKIQEWERKSTPLVHRAVEIIQLCFLSALVPTVYTQYFARDLQKSKKRVSLSSFFLFLDKRLLYSLFVFDCAAAIFVFCLSRSDLRNRWAHVNMYFATIHALIFAWTVNICESYTADVDIDALWALYSAAGGSEWEWGPPQTGSQWNFTSDSDPCLDQWQGLQCDRQGVACMQFTPCTIQTVDLVGLGLSGSIPSSFFSLNSLKELIIFGNPGLYGSVPLSVGSMTNLITLELMGNRLSGSIPWTLGSLRRLTALSMDTNLFNSSIPSSIGELTKLVTLTLSINSLSGPVPDSIGSLSQLRLLYLQFNMLSNRIPASLGKLSNLVALLLYNNSFSGQIPSALGEYPESELTDLFFPFNSLSGTIPTELFRLTKLDYFDLSWNCITGTLPSQINQLIYLDNLQINDNFLTGTIPESIQRLKKNVLFYINDNFFSGPLDAFSGCLSAIDFSFFGNRFSGTIPELFFELTALNSLDLSSNFLYGQIPDNIGLSPALITAKFRLNYFTGTLPVSLSFLDSLDLFIVDTNILTGDPSVAFSENMTSLNTVDLSSNLFSGTLGAALFSPPIIQSFCAVRNCFQGSLPIEVCDAENLLTLSLDGLSSADDCYRENNPWSTVAAYGAYMEGDIPSCYFELPKLVNFTAAGNGFTGSLPDISHNRSPLRRLVLSHNRFSGHIPTWMQEHRFSEFDLSYNKLDGAVKRLGSYNVTINRFTTSINLAFNRLSGDLPPVLSEKGEFDILLGNIFKCDPSLSRKDVHGNEYSCGSSNIDNSLLSLFFAIGIAICLISLVSVLVLYSSTPGASFTSSVRASTTLLMNKCRTTFFVTEFVLSDEIRKNLEQYHLNAVLVYINKLNSTYRVILFLFLLAVFFNLPFFIGIKMNSTSFLLMYDHQFTWIVSGIYLSGVNYAIFLLIFWTLLFVLFLSVLLWYRFKKRNMRVLSSSFKPEGEQSYESSNVIRGVAFTIINICVVLGYNGLYVYAVTAPDVTSSGRIWLQLGLTALNVLWQKVMEATLSIVLPKSFKYPYVIFFLFFTFKSVVGPLVSSIFIDGYCFRDIYFPPDAIESLYYYRQCFGFLNPVDPNEAPVCLVYSPLKPVSVVYNPPFIYSFACSSSVVANYAPVLIYYYTWKGVLRPLIVHVVNQTQKWWSNVPLLQRTISAISWTLTSQDRFPAAKLLAQQMVDCFLCITFGTLFPILIIIIYFGACSQTELIFQFILSCLSDVEERLGKEGFNAIKREDDAEISPFHRDDDTVVQRSQFESRDSVSDPYSNLNSFTSVAVNGFNFSVYLSIILAYLFYTCALLDQSGDEVGWRSSLWIIISTVVIAFILVAVYWALCIFCDKNFDLRTGPVAFLSIRTTSRATEMHRFTVKSSA
jgi:Leucine-rich repeat (LRR) protein